MNDEQGSKGTRLNAWWQQLAPRQQYVLIAAGCVLLALVLWVGAWEPLDEARQQARAQVAEQQALAGWLEALVPLASNLRRDGAPVAADADRRSLLGVVDETARAAGLAAAIGRIEPAGEQRVRIWLNDAGFATLMGWLEQIAAEQGIQIRELTAERGGQTGAVNARITLGRDA